MIYYAGVDGGGTSCRARIRDAQGQLIGEGVSGSANIMLGCGLAMASVTEAVSGALKQAGLNHEVMPSIHLGLALAGAEQQQQWHRFMQQPHPFASITLNTDAYGACLGAHSGGDGAILIAGTGSCGLLIRQDKIYRVGGREFPVSDHGSGAIMGLNLIREVLLATDGIGEQTRLYHQIMDEFSCDADQIVSWSKTALPRDYARFAPLVFSCAGQKDSLAIRLLEQTAAEIEMLMTALNRQGADRICLMGGIAERIFPWLSVPAQQWVVSPLSDAIEGALMFAGKPEHNLF